MTQSSATQRSSAISYIVSSMPVTARMQVVKYENLPDNAGVKVYLEDGRCAQPRTVSGGRRDRALCASVGIRSLRCTAASERGASAGQRARSTCAAPQDAGGGRAGGR